MIELTEELKEYIVDKLMAKSKKHKTMKILSKLYVVGERVDGPIYGENHSGTIVHGVVAKIEETLNFGWVFIRTDDKKLEILRY